ncbi:glycosyltransferase family 2 protein [uncultured Rikenella sp.]|uniref:glycosyltransferase family 2 protein n=1 Tax=uncultured Rikenella sp. TaxID=368003 RepID=UPI0025F00FCC|nr:glycosyltransferase family 2 protein [uncultured Rikenella sp.]
MQLGRDLTTTLLISTYNKPEYLRRTLESVARQTILPDEVVIADDGSTDETRQLIEEMQKRISIPIRHVWHPDDGFRKCEILNKALAQAKGEYIIQTDGDIILDRHFIADHLEMVERGYFVCGSRILLPEEITRKILSGTQELPRLRDGKIGFWLNGLRIGWLRHYLTKRFGKKAERGIRGCNTAYWKSDLIAVNGFNEDITGWGAEDAELAFRMMHNGVRKKILKMGGIVYHMWHPLSSDARLQINEAILREVKNDPGRIRCENGIDKHLSEA